MSVYTPPEHIARIAHCSSMEQYREMSQTSIKEPERFWGEIAKQFYFKEECTGKFLDYNFDCSKGKIFIKWMEGAKTNICYNCLDRHVLAGDGDREAFFWYVEFIRGVTFSSGCTSTYSCYAFY